MNTAEMPAPAIAAADLQDFVAALFAKAGVPDADAATVADCLVQADLRGVVSHGVGRVPIYLHRIAIGLVDPHAPLAVTELAPVAALVDGANGLGFVTASRAMAEAMARAGRCGMGLAYVRRGTHFGMAASYLLQAIAGGYAAFVFTNASPAMPIWGGRTPFLGTSPFAFGAPGGIDGPPLVLDMATSVVARGKIRRAAASGGTIPAGWALDRDGNPTTDAKAAYDGIILPLGGPKGSGLSLMMEVLGGVMSGAAFGGEVGNQYADEDRPQDVGHLFIALRPDLAVSAADYRARMDALASRAKACPPVEPGAEILFPGEPEARLAARRQREGIPLSAEDRAGLAQAAAKFGLTLPAFLA
ncbi:hydroxyacid dehydrogenase [Bosea sp. Root381]|uniref:Ldh family oxidoreductase n=1 Tax=Bosea sp. Root381 TaxID=1736524 RepID=UPI0007005AC5|nr:Ldh family oxidoreductase [Bosea sp. Root381]KRE18241.1 hydroxyacid dehydrogenase [Bosea sp. Root381]